MFRTCAGSKDKKELQQIQCHCKLLSRNKSLSIRVRKLFAEFMSCCSATGSVDVVVSWLQYGYASRLPCIT